MFAALAPHLKFLQMRPPEANVRILEAVWQHTRDKFYDPRMRNVDWAKVREEFLPRARAASTDEQLASLLREMLSRLRNSHIFLYTREDWKWRRNILPFCFDRVAGRTFVRYVLRDSNSTVLAPLEFGDEIIAVDAVPGVRLQPLTLARLDSIRGNPNFGPAGSTAAVDFCRGTTRSTVKVARVAQPGGFAAAVLERPLPDIIHIRLFTLSSEQLPPAHLRRLWQEAIATRGLILDLRNCVGGDSGISNFNAGSLLGPGKPLFRSLPRPGSAEKALPDQSDSQAPRFTGRAVVITNSNTESQAEILAGICKEYGCAQLVGERTAGAFNGFTVALDLPDNFALFALPYTRSVSPKGFEYEGRGIVPDELVSNDLSSFEAKHDRPLAAAMHLLKQ